ncbi:pyocin knob domain-containing protein [Levilactobacillus brevis]|uniref:pyocin knob domain-containing protein n=1 Tax=Levilactobacillus brevis TaxID=1580 RepID=UPI001F16C6A1|nr:pyocin knob domain-containing protein [Levilactobacillus brevis]MCE6038156.1 pyocin knob domain-containing protein [Levilactobacillus brevis]
MATPNVGILTTTGKALIDKVNSGQAKISFSKVVFSSMDNSQLSDTQIKALTAIAPQEVVVSSPQTTLDTNSGETRIRATGTNETLADGVYVKTYGVFAKDDTGNEILYGVTVSPNPNYFPAYDGVTPQAVTYSYKTVIQETSNITMTNSNDVYVSQEDLTEAIAKIPQPDLSGYDKTDDVDKKLQNKQDKLGFTAANDSTVVHTADMRKPANQVASIDEVNAKQDKIGYTPADDSKVLHSTIVQSSGTDLNTMMTAGFFRILNGLNTAPNSDNWTIYQVIPLSWNNGVQIAYGTNNSMLARRSWHAEGSIVFSSWVQSSDDSKVAHLSGANNFDTVPTVNNNPLLLASSLPSDLARTGQDANFTGKLQKSGVDVATVDDVSAKQDKLDYTPANAANVVHRNPDTGRATDTTDFPYKGLTVDGYPIIPLVLVPDRATAITKTAQYPNYAFMYGKELS